MRTQISVLAATVGLLVASVAGAAPAAADHVVGVGPAGCDAGPLTFVPSTILTRHAKDVSIVVRPDGAVVTTCHFKGVPKEGFNEVTEEHWVRPPAGTVEDGVLCTLGDYPGRPFAGRGEWHGSGSVTFERGNKATAVCTFHPGAVAGVDG